MNIVIVEDDINMRKSLEIALGEYDDLKIKSYKSAVEALKKMDENTDLIITDINMPQMDGLEFIKRDRRHRQKRQRFALRRNQSYTGRLRGGVPPHAR